MILNIAKPRNHINSSYCDNYNFHTSNPRNTKKLLKRLLNEDSQIE